MPKINVNITLSSHQINESPMGKDPDCGISFCLAENIGFYILVEKCKFSHQSFSSDPFSKVSPILGQHVTIIERLSSVVGPNCILAILVHER